MQRETDALDALENKTKQDKTLCSSPPGYEWLKFQHSLSADFTRDKTHKQRVIHACQLFTVHCKEKLDLFIVASSLIRE